MKVYTEQEYLKIWDGLSDEAREDLNEAIEYGEGIGMPNDDLVKHELVSIDSAMREDDSVLVFTATNDGEEVYRMGQPMAHPSGEPAIPEPSLREVGTEYNGMTASELLDIVRKTWIEYDLKSAIETAPHDDDYIAAHIIDIAVYAKPLEPLAELQVARDRIAELEAERKEIIDMAWKVRSKWLARVVYAADDPDKYRDEMDENEQSLHKEFLDFMFRVMNPHFEAQKNAATPHP